jgi:dipeptidyl aminopeptidase/acylaminoacyl peptidase
LVITGQADERVPASYVLDVVAHMQSIGMDVTPILYPGEDHFLFFSQLEAVLDDIAGWLQVH